MKKFFFIICVILPLGGIFFAFLSAPVVFAATGSNFQIKILAVCGNDAQEWNEDCDGVDLGNGTCLTEGFNSGELACQVDCVYDTSGCTVILPPPVVPGGGSGGEIYMPTPPTQTTVIFSGYAYPDSRVVLLKDAQLSRDTIAGPDAKFEIFLSDISAGNYIFGIYAEDNRGLISAPVILPANISIRALTEMGDIFISPTITVDKNSVKKGESVTISGQSAADAEVTIIVDADEPIYHQTRADKRGVYLINLDTTTLSETQYLVKSQAVFSGGTTPFSRAVSFIVGDKTILKKDQPEWLRGDLNEDWRVNLIDFSIGAYWYRKALNEKMTVKEIQVLNGDSKIDLVDFSIMAYNWTG